MAAGIESFYTQFNECGKVSLKPATEWTPYSAEFEGRIDSKRFDVIANVLYYDGTCLPVEHTGFGTRQRRLFCPLYTTWNDDYQACVNLEIFAYLTGPSLEDTCSVGNPCDVKTGENHNLNRISILDGYVSFERSGPRRLDGDRTGRAGSTHMKSVFLQMALTQYLLKETGFNVISNRSEILLLLLMALGIGLRK